MSFELSNNNLLIKNSSNEVIFNTSTPMPHIIQKTVVGSPTTTWTSNTAGAYGNHFTFPLANQYVLGHMTTLQGYNYGEPNVTYYGPRLRNFYRVSRALLPLETTTSTLLATLNIAGMNADFILVQGGLARTSVWGYGGKSAYNDPTFDAPFQTDYGVFNSAVPPMTVTTVNGTLTGSYNGKMNLSGTTVLESVFTANGEQWLTRTLSLRYVPATTTSGGKVYADWQHSSNRWESDQQEQVLGSYNNNYMNLAYSSTGQAFLGEYESYWDATFDIYFGKFTI